MEVTCGPIITKFMLRYFFHELKMKKSIINLFNIIELIIQLNPNKSIN